MLAGVWMEKKYKEEVEVSIVGSVFTLFMVAITSSLNEPLCWPPDFFICPEMCQDINTAYCLGHTVCILTKKLFIVLNKQGASLH